MTTLADLDPNLSEFIFFEEYVSEPANYTLNGYISALLGLYDWAHLPREFDVGQGIAKNYFNEGIETLRKILPYYDMGGISTYDLGYITFDVNQPNISPIYHGVHIYLLHAVHSITGDLIFKEYRDRWMGLE